MTRLVWTLCLFLCAMGMRGQSVVNPTVMRIGDREVRLSEFVCSLNESGIASTQKSVEAYASTYVDRLLKVQAARDAKMDTVAHFRLACGLKRRQMLAEALADSSMLETSLKNYYTLWKKNNGKDGVIRLSHIFVPLPQMASVAEQQMAKQRIDSIAQAIREGADFGVLAKRYAPSTGSQFLGGWTDVWLGRGLTFEEFEKQAYALEVEEVSHPFLSTVGYHIVKVLEKKHFDSYAEARNEMIRSELFMSVVRKQMVAQAVGQRGKGVSEQTYLEQQETRLMENSGEYAYRLQSYADNLLSDDYTQAQIYDKIPRDEVAFQAYLEGNASARKSFKKLTKKYQKKKVSDASGHAKKQLLSEYQTTLESRLSVDLKARYKVVVYQDVIKTVYTH